MIMKKLFYRSFIVCLGICSIGIMAFLHNNCNNSNYILFERENIEALSTAEEQGAKGRCNLIMIAYCRYTCECGAKYESASLHPGPMIEISGTCQECGRKLEIKE